MAHRKNVAIKTKYKTVWACRENCRDIKKPWTLPVPISGKIYGEVFEDGSFVLRSRKAKTSASFEFVGRIEARKDGIYLVGDIRPKAYIKGLLYFVVGIYHVVGLGFILIRSLGWIIYGCAVIAFGWIYLIYLWKSDSLYHDLIGKVGEDFDKEQKPR